MLAVSNRSQPRASFTRRPSRAGSPSSSATSICSRDRSSRARRVGWRFRHGSPERSRSRSAPVPDEGNAHSINRLEGVVTGVSYLGGITTYKVKLDSGAVVRSSMANTARIDLDVYNASQRVVAWFTPDDCVVLEQ